MLAREHHSMIWSRQRQENQLRSTRREFYPAAQAFDDLASGDAVAVLTVAPTPAQDRSLSQSKIASALRRVGGMGGGSSESATSFSRWRRFDVVPATRS